MFMSYFEGRLKYSFRDPSFNLNMDTSSAYHVQICHGLVRGQIRLNPEMQDLDPGQILLDFQEDPFTNMPCNASDHILTSCILGVILDT